MLRKLVPVIMLLTYVQEVSSLSARVLTMLCQVCFVVFLSSSRQLPEEYLRFSYNNFVLHCFKFIIALCNHFTL